jgi:tRNA threonylcarbamoyladenosine biosynthesis protein TsaE
MKKEYKITLQELPCFVDELNQLRKICKIFTFEGPLGAGKTTIIRHLLQKCGIHEPVTSPTFNYVNVYENSSRELFYHFDLYRLSSIDDFLAAGFNEFLYVENSWTLIEWPEIIMPLLLRQICKVTINICEDEKRLIRIETIE